MFPQTPYEAISWPMTQHAGVISENVIRELINACHQFHGTLPDPVAINRYLSTKGVFPDNIRTDSEKIDIWRDYQQILCELGLLYSSKAVKELTLTPIAEAFIQDELSFNELMTLQILRYQYPNGQKTALSKSLKESLGTLVNNVDTFMELQEYSGILLRPCILIWDILNELRHDNQEPILSLDEMQLFLVKCISNNDSHICAHYIIEHRQGIIHNIEPSSRARRNLSDWIKLLSHSVLFECNDSNIKLSKLALSHADAITDIISNLKNRDSFWQGFYNINYKEDWFSFYGEYTDTIKKIKSFIFE